MLIHYGTDGSVILNPDGYLTGDRYTLKKLMSVWRKKLVPFTLIGQGLLLNHYPCSESI